MSSPTPLSPVVNLQVRAILDISRLLAVTTEIDPLLVRIAEAAAALVGCERASIFVHDSDRNELWTKVALKTPEIRIPATSGIAGHAFTFNRSLHVSDPYSDPRFDAAPDHRSGFVTRNLLAMPMVDIDRQPIGVIEVINKVGSDFSEQDFSLIALLADQAGVAIQRYRLQAAAMQIVALRREMELARQVQQALIPKVLPSLIGFDLAGWTQAASIAGGDVYDVWRLPDGRLALFVADASGHGMAAALLALEARAITRAMLGFTQDPHDVLTRVHEQMAIDLDAGWFVTAFLGILDDDGALAWSSAGHGPILLRRGESSAMERFNPPAPPLGVPREHATASPEPARLLSGGALVVVSDGTHESMNARGEVFGIDRLIELLQNKTGVSSVQLIEAVREAVTAWRGPGDASDDQTILVACALPKRTGL